MTTTTITLTPREALHLTAANRILTRLTERHHPSCSCALCEARMLTDVQDGPRDGWTVPGVTLAGGPEIGPDVVTGNNAAGGCRPIAQARPARGKGGAK